MDKEKSIKIGLIVIIVAGVASLTGGIISGVNAVKRNKKMKEQERSWANE